MRQLVDTHLALWAVTGSTKLGGKARAMMAAPGTENWVSVATIAEIAIKHRLQRGSVNDMPVPGRRAWELFAAAGFSMLPIDAAHAAVLDDLPPLHGDPFDRLIIAQAISEPMRLLTRDRRLRHYSDLVELA